MQRAYKGVFFVLVSAAALFAVGATYLSMQLHSLPYFYSFSHSGLPAGPAISIAGDECTQQNTAIVKENPNKLLFMSCGGFLQ